jgi:DNA modification methylase
VIITGDCLESLRTLPSESVHCCVTSPPYWGLRDYGHDGQIGLEKSPEEYVAKMVAVFAEVRRVLRNDGTLWLNVGDSYAATTKGTGGTNPKQPTNNGSFYSANFDLGEIKPKDLCGIPWRLAFALQSDGWYLRQDIIWHKPNPMPESVRDRCTKAHEYVFLMSKSSRYYWDADSIRQDHIGTHSRGMKRSIIPERNDNSRDFLASNPLGPNRRSVWTVATQPCKEAHFAVMPQKLVEPCILAGCPEGGTVLDPFFGAGTVGLVATKLGRKFVGLELNPEYVAIAERRIEHARGMMPLLEGVN